MRRRMIGVACAAAVIVSMAGCGGSQPSGGGASPAAAVEGFVGAVQQGDGPAACAELTEPTARLWPKEGPTVGLRATTCEDLVTELHDKLGARTAQLDGRLADAQVTGSFATADWLYHQGGQQAVQLQQVDGRWRIGDTDFPVALLHWLDQG